MQINNVKDRYDCIILGGGCSGLQLSNQIIWQLQTCRDAKYKKIRILILEGRNNYKNDKTWCFWDDGSSPYCRWASNRWESWSISTPQNNEIFKHKSKKYYYHRLSSETFYHNSIGRINNSPNVFLNLSNTVEVINRVNNEFEIKAGARTYYGKKLVDCRHVNPDKVENAVWQIFYGYEIKTKASLKNLESVNLMHEIRADNSGIYFQYMLPISVHSVLFQTTYIGVDLFKPDRLKEETILTIDRLFKNWVVLRTEQGTLLQSGIFDKETVEGVCYGGSSRGAIRPSNGYAFSRITKWSVNTAKLILETETVEIKKSLTSSIVAFMDEVFLQLLRRSPSDAVRTILCLAKYLSPETFARFMSDKLNFLDIMRVVFASPKIPMIISSWDKFKKNHANKIND